jgi:hypothetical protein
VAGGQAIVRPRYKLQEVHIKTRNSAIYPTKYGRQRNIFAFPANFS